MKFELYKANDGKHKYVAVSDSSKKVKFGALGYLDRTIDPYNDARMERYLQRHSKEDWTDLQKAGTWSRYILWNKKTLEESIRDMEKIFGIKINFKGKGSPKGREVYSSDDSLESPKRASPKRSSPKRTSPKRSTPKRTSPKSSKTTRSTPKKTKSSKTTTPF